VKKEKEGIERKEKEAERVKIKGKFDKATEDKARAKEDLEAFKTGLGDVDFNALTKE